jgi:pimeloyl-ACP methyl ester carboxylesterase
MRTSRSTGGMALLDSELPRITTSTLVLWGKLDPIVPPASGERLAKTLPSARLVVLDKALHAPWIQEPKETARLMLEFFAAP